MSLKWALNTLRYENGNRKQQPTKPLTNKKCPFSTQSLNQHSRVRLSASIRACATLGHFPFVQIMSREQTVAMETVVSDAVSKATPTCVEERTKLNILWGSQAPAATHTHSPRLRKANKRLLPICNFLSESGILNANLVWSHLKSWMKLFEHSGIRAEERIIEAAAQLEDVALLRGMTHLLGEKKKPDHISPPLVPLLSYYREEKSGWINRAHVFQG